jgi:protein O-mannosyl-transferase
MQDLITSLREWKSRSPAFFDLLVALLIGSLVYLVYMQVAGHRFVPFDDHLYVFMNRHVLKGLTPETLAWAWTNLDAVNFHPLTWMTHLLDVELFGDDAGLHVFHNVLWHGAASILAFFAIRRWLGSEGLALLFAVVFALHPANVESVAWLSQRKSVISAFFWFATIWAYARYLERRQLGPYLLVIVLFWAGMLAKSAGVTLPALMLVVDLLVQRRARLPWLGSEPWSLGHWWHSGEPRRVILLVLEKLPLFFLSMLISVLTFLAQRDGGAMPPPEAFGWLPRILNPIIGYTAYLRSFLLPTELACFYPLVPRDLPSVALSGSLLALITLFALRIHRNRPLFLAGWLWFIGTLVPMIGLVQVGSQAYADRYLYLSMGGLCLMLWEAGRMLAASREVRPSIMIALGCAWILALLPVTHTQVFTWRDGLTLFGNVLERTGRHRFSIMNVAGQLASAGNTGAAIELLRPGAGSFIEARATLGTMLLMKGEHAEGLRLLEESRDASESRRDFTAHHRRVLLQHYMAEQRWREALTEAKVLLRQLPSSSTWNTGDLRLRALTERDYIDILARLDADAPETLTPPPDAADPTAAVPQDSSPG